MKDAITFRTHIGKLDKLKLTYIEVPEGIVHQLGGMEQTRYHCAVNGDTSFRAGLVALGEGRAYITFNSARMKSAGLSIGNTIEVHLEADTSEYGMDMPEELEAVLAQEPGAWERFHALPKAVQRYIIYYVSGVKRTEKRIARALLLIGNLMRLAPGETNFRKLLGKE